jgi:1-acyl-sn-glycerol-3-phosphate acyltransferase
MESSPPSRLPVLPTAPPAWLTAFASVTGNSYLLLGTALMSTLAILVSWLPPRGYPLFVIARLWSNGILKSSCLRVRVEQDPALDPQASYVFLSNHQSLFDIPVLLGTSPCQVRMMAKRSLFRIPIFGWSLAAGGFIPIDRDGGGGAARQSLSSATARLKKGTSILLFPEGTRSLTDVLLPFKRGGFLLAMKAGLPIVPVGIRGTRSVQRKDSFAIRPSEIEVRYGAPIDTAAYGVRRKKELIAEVRTRIAELAGLDVGEVGEE